MRLDFLKKIGVDTILPPYGLNITDSIIKLENSRLLAVMKINGIPFEAETDGAIENAFHGVNNLCTGLAKDFGGRLGLWTHFIKRTISLDENYRFKNSFIQAFADQYCQSFDATNFYESSYYLSFVLKHIGLDRGIADMKKILSMAKATLDKFDASVLTVVENADGSCVCENAEFLAYLYNNTPERIPLSATPVAESIVNSNQYFGYDVMEMHNSNSLSRKNAVFFLLRDYPVATCCGMWDFLLKVPHEFILSQSMVLTSNTQAIKTIDSQINKLSSTNDGAEHQIDELQFGRGYLSSGEIAFGDYQATLMVFGASAAQAIENGTAVASAFFTSGQGARWIRTTTDSIYAFSSLFPGSKNRPLASPRSTTNLSCGYSLHNYSLGKKCGNPIGDGTAVMPFKTKTDGMHYFNSHYSHPNQNVLGEKMAGHALILGATGAGKTTLQGALTAFLQRFEPLLFALDFNRSMELFIRAYGGSYFAIRDGVTTGLNPFQLGSFDDKSLLSFLYRLVGRCGADELGMISAQDEALIKNAVDAVMNSSHVLDRRFSLLMQYIPKGTDLRIRLAKWCESENGQFAWALDSAVNQFDPKAHDKIGFDTTAILDKSNGKNPVTEPVLATLLYMKDQMQVKGRVMHTIIEEFWMPCSYPLTQDLIKGTLKAGRLKGEFIYLVSQSPEDAVNIPIFPAIVQQTPTKILLPNPDAEYEGYKKIGLTTKEFKNLKQLSLESRTFLIKQSNTSCFAKMDLHGFDDFLPIISGTWETIQLCQEIRESIQSDDPERWIPIFQEKFKERKRAK